jgi:ATP-dependent Clp protease ATP-binding subunit ClpA
LSVIDVKQALNRRFKPEQVARLGNEHVIYPSLSRRAYEQLIEQACARYAGDAAQRCGLRFELDASVHEQIYANAVFPAQGTRPLFSALHAILGAGLAKAALWALERGAAAGESVGLTPARFASLVGLPLDMPEEALDPYAQRLAEFRSRERERLRA